MLTSKAIVGALFVVLLGTVAGCSEDRSGVVNFEINNREPTHWASQGYVEMVPPIRLPSSIDGRDTSEVWLKLPAGPVLGVQTVDGRAGLTYPAGADAARIEYFTTESDRSPQVADVRGTVLLPAGGEEFYVLRPNRQVLSGFRWKRGDAAAQIEANRRLGELIRSTGGGEKMAKRIQGINNCARCHGHNKAPNQTVWQDKLNNRATDSVGFYMMQTVLADEAPLETYRPRDMNLDDPNITTRCPEGKKVETKRTTKGGIHLYCPNKAVPVASFDLKKALEEGDPRAQKVCDSRRYLHQHMNQDAKAAFRAAFLACGL